MAVGGFRNSWFPQFTRWSIPKGHVSRKALNANPCSVHLVAMSTRYALGGSPPVQGVCDPIQRVCILEKR